jgi:hypothetical protein
MNKIEALNKLKAQLNEAFDRKISETKKGQIVEHLSEQPMYVLRAIFESVCDKLLDASNGEAVIKNYITLIKENSDLWNAYIVSNSIKNPRNVNNIKSFTDMSVNVLKECNSEKYRNGIKKLSDVIKEAIKESNISYDELDSIINESKTQINESIDYIVNNNFKAGNIVDWTNMVGNISDYVEKNNMMLEEKEYDGKTSEELLSELNETLNESRSNEWESKVLNDMSMCILSGRDKSELFEEYRTRCINTIDTYSEEKSVEERARLNEMKLNLQAKKYNENTLNEDLLKMAELENIMMVG